MRVSPGTFIALSASFLLALPAQGQANQTQTGPVLPVSNQTVPVPVFKAKTEEVSLDLVVQDKKHKPILDLKPEEIAITDNGAPVKLTSLRLVTGIVKNDHLITLLFDQLEANVKQGARDAAAKVLKTIPQDGFAVAVMNVDGRLRLRQRFTSDRRLLEDAVNSATEPAPGQKGWVTPVKPVPVGVKEDAADSAETDLISIARIGSDSSGKAVSERDRSLSQTLFEALKDAGQIAQDQHTTPSLAGIWALVRSEQQIRQRKAILYFTHSRQMDLHSGEVLKSIIGEANRTGTSIYVVDLNDLDSSVHMEFTQVFAQMAARPAGLGGAPGGAKLLASQPQQQIAWGAHKVKNADDPLDDSPLQNLAESTGGSFIGADDSLRKSLERMVQEMSTYYEATYVPAIEDYDGRFRAVAVKPLRAGVVLRTSSGYFALPPNAGASIRPFALPLLKIMNQSQLPADVAFGAAVLRLGELPNLDNDALVIDLPLSGVDIREDSSTNLYSAHLSVLAQIKDKNGKIVQSFSEDIPKRGALQEIEAVRAGSITFQRHFIAPPGQYMLDVVVLDNNSGQAGARHIDIDIPKQGTLSLSDLVLVRRMEPFDAATDSLEPMLHGTNRVTADISGHVAHDVKQLSVFFITHPNSHATGAATFQIQMLRNGEPLSRKPSAAEPVVGSAPSTHLATFLIRSLPDGKYEIKAKISQGTESADSSVGFVVEGGVDVTDDAVDDDSGGPNLESFPAGPLKIQIPQTPIPTPSLDEIKSILTDATTRANDYDSNLPNFMCMQVTDRSVDPMSHGKWRHKDNFIELLKFHGGEETRTMLEVNGLKARSDRGRLDGTISYGEFGGVLKSVFQLSSKTVFQWKATAGLGDGTVQVFDYHVDRKNSTFYIGASSINQVVVGFHGQVFIDSATRSVRRVTMVADKLEKFPMRSTTVSVDYDYILINDHDYLLPVGGQVSTRVGHFESVLNQIEFRDYRRFGSNATILDTPVEDETPPQSQPPATRVAKTK